MSQNHQRMPRLPWTKWFPQDWLGDTGLRMCSNASKGAWMDTLMHMAQSSTHSLSFPVSGWARMWSESLDEANRIIGELDRLKIAEVSREGDSVTISSRRLHRELRTRDGNRSRSSRFRENGGGSRSEWESLRSDILLMDGNVCCYCGRKASVVDHVIPRSKGGESVKNNLVACCKTCSNTKGVGTPEDVGFTWFKKPDRITYVISNTKATPQATHEATPTKNKHDVEVGDTSNTDSNTRSNREKPETRDQKPEARGQNPEPIDPEAKQETKASTSAIADEHKSLKHAVEFMQEWNGMAEKNKTIPRCRDVKGARGRSLSLRMKDPEWASTYRDAIKKIPSCPFLMAQTGSSWVANVDWFLKPGSVRSIIEGKYDRRVSSPAPSSRAFESSNHDPDKFKRAMAGTEVVRNDQPVRKGTGAVEGINKVGPGKVVGGDRGTSEVSGQETF